ncbi:MAG: DUF4292 domain-containing protein [bacterium]|nr:DUF4292 domain-containing protein [bacterium]
MHIVASQTQNLQDVQARARVDLRIDNIRQKGLAVIAFRSPDRLKLDISDTLLGIGVLSARSWNDSLAVYLPRENRYLEGPLDEVLYRVTGVDLAYYGARAAILGLPNLSPILLPNAGPLEIRGDTLSVRIVEPFWIRKVRLDRRTLTLQEEQIHTPQGVLLSRRILSEYRTENGVLLPGHTEIIQGKDRIQIRVEERTVNQGVTQARFEMKIPSDAVRLDADN